MGGFTPTRPDLQLLFIGLTLGGGLLVAMLSSLPLIAGVAVGSGLAAVVVLDGIALNPPVED